VFEEEEIELICIIQQKMHISITVVSCRRPNIKPTGSLRIFFKIHRKFTATNLNQPALVPKKHQKHVILNINSILIYFACKGMRCQGIWSVLPRRFFPDLFFPRIFLRRTFLPRIFLPRTFTLWTVFPGY
jgi:hypothetical protein